MKKMILPLMPLTLLSLSTFSVAIFSTPTFCWAADSEIARVVSVRGEVKLDGNAVKEGQMISGTSLLETGTTGGAKIVLLPSQTELQLGAGGSLKVEKPAEKGPGTVEHLQGMLRAKVKKSKIGFTVKGKAAVMGVRGTDFISVSNAVLGESEIIVFDGKVEFTSASDPKDTQLVPPKHWGGIGGRFGAKVSKLMKLPDSVLKHFDEASTLH